MPVGHRQLLEPSELWPQERQLFVNAAEGTVLDLRSRRPGEDDPSRGREWSLERRIRAQVLFQLLTGCGPGLATDVVAVRLRGAQIVGRLNLGGWKLRCPLELYQCYLRYQFDLAKAEAPNISLRGSCLRSGLSARRLQVTHTLNLTGVRCGGGVSLHEAHIGGQLDCTEAVFSNPGGNALAARRLTVDAGMFLGKVQCTGEVQLRGAHIGDQVDCTEAVFSNPDGEALEAEGLQVDASMFLRKVRCAGGVSLHEAHIGGQLDCTEAVFSNPDGEALEAERLQVDASMFLRKVRCAGGVWLLGAHIGGQLDCAEAIFSNPDGHGLLADGLTVDSDMSFGKVRCTGGVSLLGAHIGGQLDCAEAVFSNPDGEALAAERLKVDGGLFMWWMKCTGEVWLSGGQIGGQLNCTEAVFSNPDGRGLLADKLTVNGGMFLQKVQCSGEVSLSGAHIGGQLNCTEAVFNNLGEGALTASGLAVDADMLLEKVRCTGGVWLPGAHIRGELDCTEAIFSNPDRVAVYLQHATVVQSVTMRPAAFHGSLDLCHACVGAWYDEKRTWPKQILLEGFVYGSIDAPDAAIKDRLRSWLPGSGYLPQPYEQLAGVYRREGNEQSARTVAIDKQRARRAASAKQRLQRADDVNRVFRYLSLVWSAVLQAWSAGLRWTIGYGYRPALALIPLAVLILIGSVLFQLLSHYPDLLHPAKSGAEQPSFNSFRYSMDLLLPVANFKQRDAFIAEGWAAWVSFGFTFVGWLLAAVIVAGLSGVFKRD